MRFFFGTWQVLASPRSHARSHRGEPSAFFMKDTEKYVKRIQNLSKEDGECLSKKEAQDLLLRLSESIKLLVASSTQNEQ